MGLLRLMITGSLMGLGEGTQVAPLGLKGKGGLAPPVTLVGMQDIAVVCDCFG